MHRSFWSLALLRSSLISAGNSSGVVVAQAQATSHEIIPLAKVDLKQTSKQSLLSLVGNFPFSLKICQRAVIDPMRTFITQKK